MKDKLDQAIFLGSRPSDKDFWHAPKAWLVTYSLDGRHMELVSGNLDPAVLETRVWSRAQMSMRLQEKLNGYYIFKVVKNRFGVTHDDVDAALDVLHHAGYTYFTGSRPFVHIHEDDLSTCELMMGLLSSK